MSLDMTPYTTYTPTSLSPSSSPNQTQAVVGQLFQALAAGVSASESAGSANALMQLTQNLQANPLSGESLLQNLQANPQAAQSLAQQMAQNPSEAQSLLQQLPPHQAKKLLQLIAQQNPQEAQQMMQQLQTQNPTLAQQIQSAPGYPQYQNQNNLGYVAPMAADSIFLRSLV